MDFAKKLLSKYGWKEGNGLGKNNDGINIPLKAAYKFNKTGLGHNEADDLNNHWWEKVYNAASENVDVNTNDAGIVSMDLKTGDSVEITTKNYSISTKDNNFYKGHFLRTSTLENTGKEVEVEDKDVVISKSTSSNNPFKVVSDEDLLRACKGRTAHKGARHGLKLSGKLARIEEQERKLLAQMGITYTAPPQDVVAEEWTKVKVKKQKRKEKGQCIEIVSDIIPVEEKKNSIEDTLQEADYHKKSKKKAKKQRKLDEEMASALASVTTNDAAPEVVAEVCEKKKKKKSKHQDESLTETNESEEFASKKSSRKRRIDEVVQANDITMVDATEVEVPKTKRQKSSKKRKDFVDPSTPFEVEHFKKAEEEGHLVPDEMSEKQAAKIERKKERQLRRLAKQVDQNLSIE